MDTIQKRILSTFKAELGMELLSSEKQLQNGTFVFRDVTSGYDFVFWTEKRENCVRGYSWSHISDSPGKLNTMFARKKPGDPIENALAFRARRLAVKERVFPGLPLQTPGVLVIYRPNVEAALRAVLEGPEIAGRGHMVLSDPKGNFSFTYQSSVEKGLENSGPLMFGNSPIVLVGGADITKTTDELKALFSLLQSEVKVETIRGFRLEGQKGVSIMFHR